MAGSGAGGGEFSDCSLHPASYVRRCTYLVSRNLRGRTISSSPRLTAALVHCSRAHRPRSRSVHSCRLTARSRSLPLRNFSRNGTLSRMVLEHSLLEKLRITRSVSAPTIHSTQNLPHSYKRYVATPQVSPAVSLTRKRRSGRGMVANNSVREK